MHNGKIYSTEGFDEKIHPAIRIIDVKDKKEIFFHDFCDSNIPHEAEFIDFYNSKLVYGDYYGNLFELIIE